LSGLIGPYGTLLLPAGNGPSGAKVVCGVRVALIQLDVDLAEPPEDRRERALALVRAQQGADLVVLPELWLPGGFGYELWPAVAETLEGTTVRAASLVASETGTYLHAGSIVERDERGRFFNTSLFFGPDGRLLRTYRKIHRFGFAGGEVELMSPGEEVATQVTPFGTVGFATCYDLRFPELFRMLLDAGTQLLLVPAAWPARRREHWRLLARARAVESQSYVLACNTAGEHGGVPQAGHSLVVDPWGEVLAEAGSGERVLVAEIDPATVTSTRDQFPVLRDRRLPMPPAG
jgi:predicted amidohydrolase